ncbi:uncharacterized protein LOC124838575 [Vigna umbellata]|uniref:uncharacterized protein LOC124838575 n=1 Tax=Vigna umbellata TaxID=87088 RepID=UPI001F5E652E|nr:uncharacterized protein LOC124838575 [Vigna umbellata]
MASMPLLNAWWLSFPGSAGCAGRSGGAVAFFGRSGGTVAFFGERKKTEVGEGDYTDQFSTDQIFPTRANLIEWVRKIAFDLGFVVVIIRSDTATGEAGRKTFILLGCERSGKYRKYKPDVQPSFSGTRKCECSFRLRGKPKGDGWVLKLMCGYHNHELAETLVGHPFAGRLNVVEQSILVDMTNSLVKSSNILLTLKEHNEDNVTTIKQIYNARYTYKRSLKGSRTEMQHLMLGTVGK